jgi:hypothetical protein
MEEKVHKRRNTSRSVQRLFTVLFECSFHAQTAAASLTQQHEGSNRRRQRKVEHGVQKNYLFQVLEQWNS